MSGFPKMFGKGLVRSSLKMTPPTYVSRVFGPDWTGCASAGFEAGVDNCSLGSVVPQPASMAVKATSSRFVFMLSMPVPCQCGFSSRFQQYLGYSLHSYRRLIGAPTGTKLCV